ncbi:DUF4209 domain-containing protein [Dickeya zeae]|uniref:DUF4209 domain-containing protein n=1 Tax=Dickeya zeae TaxID=204042 RepID=UPI0020C1386B|nr:DUF4209 domain-containing protein [Dickeya zeae]
MTDTASLSADLPPLTLSDFHEAGLDDLLMNNSDADINSLKMLLLNASKTHVRGAARALTLLYNVVSMILVPDEPAVVFRPFIILSDGRCSMGPEHLSSDDIDILAQVANTIRQPVLRARIADLVWFLDRRRGVQYPQMAIEAYRSQPINSDTWCGGNGVGWHRALQLAKQISATEQIEQTVDALLNAFFKTSERSDLVSLHFIKPLLIEKNAGSRQFAVAAELERVGCSYLKEGNAFAAEPCFNTAADWYQWAGDAGQYNAMLAMAARAIELQAEQADGAIIQHHWYTKAIEAYRRVEVRYRKRLGIEGAVEELRHKREVAGHATLEEMIFIKGPSVNVAALVAEAVNHVKGRKALEALIAYSELDDAPDADALKLKAEDSLRTHPLSAMLNSAVLASDGRQVANKGPQSGWGNQIEAKARELFREHAQLIAVSSLIPALDHIRNEHVYRETDFILIAQHSPIVPTDRARIVAKGLYAGFYGDMVQAIHILMPQFEHMVRQILQGAGALTTEHRPDGRDMEVALTSLLGRPQMIEEFGEGITLAIEAIMCDQAGSNLRNDIAHGLADENLCSSPFAIYAWWMVLQLVVRTFAATQEA